MAEKIGGFGRFLWRHKYLVTLVVFGALIGFVDDNSFWNRFQLERKNNELRSEIATTERLCKESLEELEKFKDNPKAFEKVARVERFMRGENEDVFIVSEDSIN